MNKTVLNVHPSLTSSIFNMQYQLYLKMKNDPESQVADSSIWDALKKKYKRSLAPYDTCRPEALQNRDHDDHLNEHPEGEEGSKRQKTTKGSSSANKESFLAKVTSSSKTTTVRKTKTYSSQLPIQEYDEWSMAQEVEEDEDISE
ncbi:hypothetical protein Tco_1192028 [Tanacetum coccineum]